MRTQEETQAFIEVAANRMRFEPTAAEKRLRPALEALGFVAQYPILVPNRKYAQRTYPYVLDFYHPGKQLCVEVDGGIHARQRGRDRRRDERLRMAGVVTVRVSNAAVMRDLHEVLADIQAML